MISHSITQSNQLKKQNFWPPGGKVGNNNKIMLLGHHYSLVRDAIKVSPHTFLNSIRVRASIIEHPSGYHLSLKLKMHSPEVYSIFSSPNNSVLGGPSLAKYINHSTILAKRTNYTRIQWLYFTEKYQGYTRRLKMIYQLCFLLS